MKRKLITLIMALMLGFATNALMAQTSPPPPPADHGSTGNQPAGGAPIGEGMVLLVALGAAYGGYKLYRRFHDQQLLEE